MAYGVMLPADLVQESVLTTLEKWHRIQKQDSLLAFMVGVAGNIVKTQFRKLKRETRIEIEKEAFRHLESAAQDPAVAYDIHLMYKAMERLGDQEKECLLMFEISGLSIKEIAVIQRCSVGAVKTRLHRTRQKLQELLQDSYSAGSTQSASTVLMMMISL